MYPRVVSYGFYRWNCRNQVMSARLSFQASRETSAGKTTRDIVSLFDAYGELKRRRLDGLLRPAARKNEERRNAKTGKGIETSLMRCAGIDGVTFFSRDTSEVAHGMAITGGANAGGHACVHPHSRRRRRSRGNAWTTRKGVRRP